MLGTSLDVFDVLLNLNFSAASTETMRKKSFNYLPHPCQTFDHTTNRELEYDTQVAKILFAVSKPVHHRNNHIGPGSISLSDLAILSIKSDE